MEPDIGDHVQNEFPELLLIKYESCVKTAVTKNVRLIWWQLYEFPSICARLFYAYQKASHSAVIQAHGYIRQNVYQTLAAKSLLEK